MCTGQKIRVMLNEAYTTASPLSFTGSCQTNSSQGWEMWRALKTQLEIQGSKGTKNEHNRNPHIPNITPHLHQWEQQDVKDS